MTKLIQISIILMWLSLFFTIFFILMKMIHPIILMMSMILFNLISCIIMSIWKFNYIYSIILFLIMISGLLIIFMYFSSLVSNEEMNIKLNSKFTLLFLLNSMNLMSFMYSKNFTFFNSLHYSSMESNPLYFLTSLNKLTNLINLYNYPFNNLTMMSIFLILLTFIIIMKINFSSHSFPMRKLKK